MDEILLPYGDRPYALRLRREAAVLHPPKAPPAKALGPLLDHALDHPIGSRRLEDLPESRGRVVIIVSDSTRADPRKALVEAVLPRLAQASEIAIAIANGTHAPCDPHQLGLGEDLLRRYEIIQHDARDDRALVALGTTARGTPVRVHHRLVEADLVVATGTLRPHYFAGYGAGAKAIFPGLGGERDIRVNHLLKGDEGARAGIVDANPCRLDLEEAAEMVPGRAFLLNVVADADGGCQAAVAGDLRSAFREGARLCAPLFTVRANKAPVVVVSDHLPVTESLYQASKLVAAAAPLVEEQGVVVVAAQCPGGIGPLATVNEGIYELGIRPRLPRSHRILLVSDLEPADVEASYCEYAGRVEDVLEALRGPALILPRASGVIIEPEDLQA
jgi:lactate racemase